MRQIRKLTKRLKSNVYLLAQILLAWIIKTENGSLMNPNLSAILKSTVVLFALYWVALYAAVLPELIYLFALKIGIVK